MASEPPRDTEKSDTGKRQPKPANLGGGNHGGDQCGDVSAPNGEEPEQVIERATEKAVKRELRWPESIMAFFTIVIAFAAMEQCHEMQTSGVDTRRLAEAAYDQVEVANAQEKALSAMAAAESGQLNTLNQSVLVAKTSAEAAKRMADEEQKSVQIQDFENSPAFTLQHLDITGFDGVPDQKTGKINITAHIVFQNIGNVRFTPAPSFFWIIFRDDLGKPQKNPWILLLTHLVMKS